MRTTALVKPLDILIALESKVLSRSVGRETRKPLLGEGCYRIGNVPHEKKGERSIPNKLSYKQVEVMVSIIDVPI